jgi:hypothetical protein
MAPAIRESCFPGPVGGRFGGGDPPRFRMTFLSFLTFLTFLTFVTFVTFVTFTGLAEAGGRL